MLGATALVKGVFWPCEVVGRFGQFSTFSVIKCTEERLQIWTKHSTDVRV